MDRAFDGAHLEAPLAVDQGESSWLCAELVGVTPSGPRRFAVLAWLHRTGPRLGRFDAGLGVLDKNHLPAELRALVPSWMPIVTPVRIHTDDRPLLMIVLYDLDRADVAPLHIERDVEHADFDAETFSASTHEIALRVLSDRIVVEADTLAFRLRLEARPTKRAVHFGVDSPFLRHGDIEVGYLQRPRLDVRGTVELGGARVENLVGEGAHDRHWRHASVQDLAWLWLHLRLGADREVNCYVIRDARSPSRERGRAASWIAADGAVHPLDNFDLSERGAAYVFAAPALSLRLVFSHAVEAPYLPMRAFGDAIDGGIAEAPIRVVDGAQGEAIAGWLEVFDAQTCRITNR